MRSNKLARSSSVTVVCELYIYIYIRARHIGIINETSCSYLRSSIIKEMLPRQTGAAHDYPRLLRKNKDRTGKKTFPRGRSLRFLRAENSRGTVDCDIVQS